MEEAMETATETVDKAQVWIQKLYDLLILWGPKVLLAIVLLVIGIMIINRLVRVMKRVMKKRDMDPTLIPFLSGLVNILLKTMLIISVIDIVGVKTTSFVAILGAAGLAVGLALQGSLANFAGGVLIIIFKPYKVGDYIEAQGEAGTVKGIQIFNTILTTPDNVLKIVPNGAMSSGTITNYSAQETRRIDLVYGISYGDDIEKARAILKEMAEADSRVLTDPEPFIAVKELADSSVNLLVRIWCKKEDYWDINFDWQKDVKLRFDKEDLSFPFPQREVTTFVGKS
jgi:small conductance mechanosensitive channel